ncbi:9079_t:CDS:2 [Entrophospora sp. SA101]|nr:9079_t:CDS:2 [Entrophospora sp. SA101]
MRTDFNERDIETFIESKLKSLDYILYQSGTTTPLIVIETKKPGEDIHQALEQGVNYAKNIEAPLVIATNGEFTKAYHINFQRTLTLNGEEVKDFFAEKEALRFIEQPHLITQENKVVLSRRELIKIFAEANDLLRKEGFQAGDERFSEFANILFLKIIGEIEETLEHFRQKYQEGELFSVSKIEDAKTLEEIVAKLNPLSLVETEREIKGEAFEYFLQRYNAGEKDLGEYFTPRHVIRNLVNILQPRFKEKVYDPFCGTGGMLIECFKYVSERIKLDPQNKEVLTNCFYGNEITNVARITKMNMILFGDGHNNIQRRDTFQFPVKEKYDLIITNIPFGFSDIDYGNLYPISCKYGDCLAIQHCLMACKENGRVAMIMPEGFFNQRAKKGYRDTKKWIIENYSIQAVISLPKGIFLPYTGSKSSAIIIEKKKKTRDYFYYYQIKNDGFTLNNYRDRVEGDIENDKYNLLAKPLDFSLLKREDKQYFPLSEIADVKRGCFELKRAEFMSHGFAKVYQPNHAISGDFSSGDRYITEERYQQLKNFQLQTNDIIMSVSGTWGKVAVFPDSAKKGIAILSEDVMENLRVDHLKNLPIPVVSLEEQTKIISGLNKIKQSIQNAQQIIDNLKLPLFVSLMKPTEYKKLGEIASFEYGYTATASEQGEFRYIRITDIDEQGNISQKDKKYVDLANEADKEKYLLKEKDLIVARIGSVGKTAIFQVEQLTKGTVQPQFNANSLKEIMVPIPSLENQKKAVEQLTKIKANFQNIKIKDKKDIEVSFLPMEDCEEYSLWVYPQETKKIEEVYQGYTYFAENDLLIAKITPCFENGKMSIAKNLVNSIGFGEGKKHMTGTTGRQRLKLEFIENFLIPVPPLEVQKKLVKELEEEQEVIDYQKRSISLLKKKEQKFLNSFWDD